LGFRFARHKLSLGACYALNTKFLTGPDLLPDLFWSIAVKRRDALSHKAQRRVIRRAIASKHSG
ncbi:hypothetical protein, partial [Burkholderia stagnalis]|uniref:hypothetical protein n=1 Tax=Burkholderia stagnalis TaxID=1503054 RepID=UPI001E473849